VCSQRVASGLHLSDQGKKYLTPLENFFLEMLIILKIRTKSGIGSSFNKLLEIF